MEKEVEKESKQEQLHKILFGREISWQEIIYDLINSEQLDPWDIDIIKLSDAFLERIRKMEEADFFISSKVLLAAALLLRIKSEIILNNYLKSIDEILFGKKEEQKKQLERIELDEDIPLLIPKTPLPRLKKVTLEELMESLNKAIKTETRRIKRVILDKNALRETSITLPKKTKSIKNLVVELYHKIRNLLADRKKITYSKLVGEDREERIMSLLPLINLEVQEKIWLEQESSFEEIYVWLREIYFKHNPDPFAELREEIEEEIDKLSKEDKTFRKRKEKIEKEFKEII